MPQSNVIFGFLFIGFMVWVTVRGELATYIGYLIRPKVTGTNTASAATNTQSGPNSSQLASAAVQAVMIAGAA